MLSQSHIKTVCIWQSIVIPASWPWLPLICSTSFENRLTKSLVVFDSTRARCRVWHALRTLLRSLRLLPSLYKDASRLDLNPLSQVPLAKESTWLQLAGANGCILKNCEFWPCRGHLRGLQSSWKLVAATSFRSTCKPETGTHWDPSFRTMDQWFVKCTSPLRQNAGARNTGRYLHLGRNTALLPPMYSTPRKVLHHSSINWSSLAPNTSG